ncbi:hypothetical protein Hanom_Chr02g00130071 [Helianthus anomalus]
MRFNSVFALQGINQRNLQAQEALKDLNYFRFRLFQDFGPNNIHLLCFCSFGRCIR